MEITDYLKDGIILLVGGGAVWKAIMALLSSLKSGNKSSQNVTVNACNTSGAEGGKGSLNNVRVYATKEELSKHALDCAGGIHEKINKNYQKLLTQINTNHTESMKTFAELQVSMARLETMRNGG